MPSLDLIGIDVRNRQFWQFYAHGKKFYVEGNVIRCENGESTTFEWVGTQMKFATPLRIKDEPNSTPQVSDI